MRMAMEMVKQKMVRTVKMAKSIFIIRLKRVGVS